MAGSLQTSTLGNTVTLTASSLAFLALACVISLSAYTVPVGPFNADAVATNINTEKATLKISQSILNKAPDTKPSQAQDGKFRGRTEPFFEHLDKSFVNALPYENTILNESPLMVQFENFLSDDDITAIQSLCAPLLERSTGGLEREISDYRTSSTAWMMPDLYKNTKYETQVLSLIERIAELTQIPAINQEHFQVLHYGPNQYYRTHHDYIREHANMPCDVRVATFFIYMNDVEEGGGTHFPELGITVKPKRGRAVLWYNTVNNTAHADNKALHEAQPVIRGEKWGANVWIHARNFYDNWLVGKTG